MRRISLIAACVLVSGLTFAQIYKLSVTRNDGQTLVIPTDDIAKIEFVEGEASGAVFSVVPQTKTVPYFGGNVTFKISANCQWTYKVDNDKVSEVSQSNSQLVLNFPGRQSSEPVTFSVTFQYSGMETVVTLDQETSPRADLLDIEFKADGTAVDVSPMHNEVITNPSNALMTYYSDMHGRYVANFRNAMGQMVTSGYYRVNYQKGGEFINRIADGCTFETIIKLNESDNPNREVKWFSSMQSGGIGFILPIHNAANTGTKCLTFLPNVSTTGASNWRWTYSDVEPKPGVYYHVVGVWNKEEGKSYIYVNGRLSGTASAPGNYVPVASGAESFVLGGDPGTNQTDCDAAWNGEIVTARIYDAPFDASQVAGLWEESRFDESASTVTISDLVYLPECNVAPGNKYSVYGKGFMNGDAVELQAIGSDAKLQPAVSVDDERLTLTVPEGITSGDYKVILVRGGVQSPLFQVTFNVGQTPVERVAPKIIAHRGAHTDGASENSIAALKKAMDANYYGIELDIWITTDGQLVVHHDGVASGLTFANCTYDQIKNLRLSNGEALPTFDSFISTFKEKMGSSTSKLIIEIKTHAALARSLAATDKAMQMVEAAGLKDRVEYIAFSYDVCKRIVANQPDAMVGYLNGDKTPATILADGIRSIDYNMSPLTAHPEWIKECRELGMISNVWTVNTVTDMLRFTGYGIDYITTDAPADLDRLNNMKFVE